MQTTKMNTQSKKRGKNANRKTAVPDIAGQEARDAARAEIPEEDTKKTINMATFEEKAERLKKELEEAPNGDQRRNLSHEYELTLRLLRIIRGEVFTLDDINKCRQEKKRQKHG